MPVKSHAFGTTLLVLTVGYLAIALWMWGVLDPPLRANDVIRYWRDSLTWQRPFDPYHVPAYPLAIAGWRTITHNFFHPLLLMMSINFIGYLVSSLLLCKIFRRLSIPRDQALLGIIIYGLWPFVGLTYTVVPMADTPALCLFLAGLLAALSRRPRTAAALWALAMVTHKAMWLFCLLGMIAMLADRRERIGITFQSLIIIVAPLTLLWVGGAVYHGTPTWLLASNIETEVVSRSYLPLLDGLIGPWVVGGVTNQMKGLVTVLLGITVVALLITIHRHQELLYYRYGIAIALSIMLMLIILNQHEIWAAVRFSRPLIIPLAMVTHQSAQIARWIRPKIVAPAIGALFFSQMAYGWYWVTVFGH